MNARIPKNVWHYYFALSLPDNKDVRPPGLNNTLLRKSNVAVCQDTNVSQWY